MIFKFISFWSILLLTPYKIQASEIQGTRIFVGQGGVFVPDALKAWNQESGGKRSKILILPWGLEDPESEKEWLVKKLKSEKLGYTSVSTAPALAGLLKGSKSPDSGRLMELKNLIESSNTIYIPDEVSPQDFNDAMKNKHIGNLLRDAVSRGKVLTLMGKALTATAPRTGKDFPKGVDSSEMSDGGSGLISDIIVKPGFDSREDLFKLLMELAATPEAKYALGLSSKTAAIVKNDELTGLAMSPSPEFNIVSIEKIDNKNYLLRTIRPGFKYPLSIPKNKLPTQKICRADINKNVRAIISGEGYSWQEARLSDYKKIRDWIGVKKSVLVISWAHDSSDFIFNSWVKPGLIAAGVNEKQIIKAPSYKEMMENSIESTNTLLKALSSEEKLGAVVFTGGDQNRHMDILNAPANKKLKDLLIERINKGMVFAGGSAGSLMASSEMFTGAHVENDRNPFQTETTPGMAIVPSANFDVHFDTRTQRFLRLIGSLRPNSSGHLPKAYTAIAIGEGSSVIYEGGTAKVGGDDSLLKVNRVDSNGSTFLVQILEPGEDLKLENCYLNYDPMFFGKSTNPNRLKLLSDPKDFHY